MSKKSQYTKSVVQPKGDFTLMNSTGEVIHHFRPTLVVFTPFISEKLADGVLKVLSRGLPMEATDDEFLECFNECDKDVEYSVAAYSGEFNLDVDGEVIDEKKPAGARIPRRKKPGPKPKDNLPPPPPIPPAPPVVNKDAT